MSCFHLLHEMLTLFFFFSAQRYFEYFAYHCRLSILDDTLMDYLRSFEGVTNHLLTNVLLVDSPSSDAFYGFLVSTFTILDSLRQTVCERELVSTI